jgi:aerobic carbon-monoxide dehydrogenase large subunit
MKFGIGQPMRRHEDLRLITGRGCYTDDVILPRMTHAFVLRSPVAHAHIKHIDAAAARRMPGVLFVATGEDVRADGLGDVPCMVPLVNRDGTPRHDTPRPVLALGKVRHVGQPVALVVAETLTAARDAAEAIDVEYEPLPATTEVKDAISPGAPQLFDRRARSNRPPRFQMRSLWTGLLLAPRDLSRRLLSVGTRPPAMTCRANAGRMRPFPKMRTRFG